MRRAQGLPITIIIIAALGILVLIVIGAIFGVQITKLGRAASECPGTCIKPTLPDDVGQLTYLFREGSQCLEFETELTGTFIPKGLPRDKDPDEWKCLKCCVPTG